MMSAWVYAFFVASTAAVNIQKMASTHTCRVLVHSDEERTIVTS